MLCHALRNDGEGQGDTDGQALKQRERGGKVSGKLKVPVERRPLSSQGS
jgi:hypothetical protein